MSFSGRPRWWQALRKTERWVTLAVAAELGIAAVPSFGAMAAHAANLANVRIGWIAAAAVLGAATLGAGVAEAKGRSNSEPIELQQLPREAQATYHVIFSGGPFASPRDGAVFGNRERTLPAERRGFYHEYTVRTPGAHNRGARRIVCGGAQTTQPDACFYTSDHYTTFRRIAP